MRPCSQRAFAGVPPDRWGIVLIEAGKRMRGRIRRPMGARLNLPRMNTDEHRSV